MLGLSFAAVAPGAWTLSQGGTKKDAQTWHDIDVRMLLKIEVRPTPTWGSIERPRGRTHIDMGTLQMHTSPALSSLEDPR